MISDSLLKMLRHDVKPEIRKCILKNIDKLDSAGLILERSRDVDADVRKEGNVGKS